MNFCKAFTVGSFPVAFFVLSFAGVVSLRSLMGDVLVRSLFDFLLLFFPKGLFRGVFAEGFPSTFLQRLVGCAFF